MARRIRDPEARQHIVEAAWRLVAERGSASTTLRAVAVEAGVSTGSVTHYFEDRTELMAAVLHHNNALSSEAVRRSIGKRRGLDAVERATLGLLPVDEKRLAFWQVWLGFWAQEPEDESGNGGFVTGYRNWSSLVDQHLREAMADGELPDDLDVRHEVSILSTLVAGTGLLAGSTPTNRNQLRTRAKRIIREHFVTLTDRLHSGTP